MAVCLLCVVRNARRSFGIRSPKFECRCGSRSRCNRERQARSTVFGNTRATGQPQPQSPNEGQASAQPLVMSTGAATSALTGQARELKSNEVGQARVFVAPYLAAVMEEWMVGRVDAARTGMFMHAMLPAAGARGAAVRLHERRDWNSRTSNSEIACPVTRSHQ